MLHIPIFSPAGAAGRQASLGVPTTPCVPHRRPVPRSAVRSPASGSRANNVDFLKVTCIYIYIHIYIYITIYLYIHNVYIIIYCIYIIIYIYIINYNYIYKMYVTVYVCIYCICSAYIVYVLYICILTINYISGKNLQSG